MNRYTLLNTEQLKTETMQMLDKSKSYLIRSDVLFTSEANLIRKEWEERGKLNIWNSILQLQGVI
jgi:hypothetical protein